MEEKSKLQLIGEIAQANNKNLELIEEINEKEDEIERLNKLINYKGLEDIPQYVSDLEVDNKSLKKENKILNSIIKEVRELIKRDLSTDKVNNLIYSELLDIIGEENKND